MLQAEIDEAERRARDSHRQYSIKAKRINGAWSKPPGRAGLITIIAAVIFIVLKASEHIASAAEARIPRSQSNEMAKRWKAGIKLIKS